MNNYVKEKEMFRHLVEDDGYELEDFFGENLDEDYDVPTEEGNISRYFLIERRSSYHGLQQWISFETIDGGVAGFDIRDVGL